MKAISRHIKISGWEAGLIHLTRRLNYKLMTTSFRAEAIGRSIRSFSEEGLSVKRRSIRSSCNEMLRLCCLTIAAVSLLSLLLSTYLS